ncbi:hypothetical protein [Nostocoides japonicum]|nr:hypothetical protein [Tetrasphaera japonica]
MAIASIGARLTAGLSDALLLSRQLHQGLAGCRRHLQGSARREFVEPIMCELQVLAQEVLIGLHGVVGLAGLVAAASSIGLGDDPGLELLDIALRLATDSAAAAASASAAATHALSYKPATGSCEATTMCDRFLRTACVESATVVDQLESAIAAASAMMSGRPRLRLAQ